MPSLVVVLPSAGNIGSRERSSMSIIFTGSTASTMETGEWSAFASGMAREELMQRRAKMMALESREC